MNTVLAARSDLHINRKLWHIMWGATGLALFYAKIITLEFCIQFTFLFAMSGFLLDYLRVKYAFLNNLIIKIAGPFMRESEKHGASGLPFYAIGVSLSLMFFSEKVALLSVFFLVFSDPIISLFGVLYGKNKILPNKSLEGSLAGFFLCSFITALYVSLSTPDASPFKIILFSFLGGVIGTTSEILSAFGVDDNLTIPLVSGFGLSVVNYFMPVLF